MAHRLTIRRLLRRLLALTLFMAAGCSTTELKTTETETFDPRIFPDGTKTFVYTLEDHGRPTTQTYIRFQDQRLQDTQNNAETAPDPQEQAQARAEWRFHQLLKAKLEQTGFCRSGYIELEADISPGGKSMLRGECREAATAEDRERFTEKARQR